MLTPTLLIGKQDELKAEQARLAGRLADLTTQIATMPDPKVLQQEAMVLRLALLEQVQERDWRKLSFDEIRRFLVFLFGENPLKTGDGISVTREKSRWRISFKGQVGFYHDVVNGRAISHLAKAEAARHNAAVNLTGSTH